MSDSRRPDYHAELDALVRAVKGIHRFRLVIVGLNHTLTAERLLSDLSGRGALARIVRLSKTSSFLVEIERLLATTPAQEVEVGSAALAVVGLENLISPLGHSPELESLNLNRDHLSTVFKRPLVVLLPEWAVRQFSYQAVDLWAIRSNYFRFAGTPFEIEESVRGLESILSSSSDLAERSIAAELLLASADELASSGSAPDWTLECRCFLELARARISTWALDRARDYVTMALESAQTVPSLVHTRSLLVSGWLHRLDGDINEALVDLMRAESAFRQSRQPDGVAEAAMEIAEVLLLRGTEADLAFVRAQLKAGSLSSSLVDPLRLDILEARVENLSGRPSAALGVLARLSPARAEFAADIEVERAKAFHLLGRLDNALASSVTAIAAAGSCHDLARTVEAEIQTARILIDLGESLGADRHLQRASDISATARFPLGVLSSKLAKVKLDLQSSASGSLGINLVHSLVEEFRNLGLIRHLLEALLLACEAEHSLRGARLDSARKSSREPVESDDYLLIELSQLAASVPDQTIRTRIGLLRAHSIADLRLRLAALKEISSSLDASWESLDYLKGTVLTEQARTLEDLDEIDEARAVHSRALRRFERADSRGALDKGYSRQQLDLVRTGKFYSLLLQEGRVEPLEQKRSTVARFSEHDELSDRRTSEEDFRAAQLAIEEGRITAATSHIGAALETLRAVTDVGLKGEILSLAGDISLYIRAEPAEAAPYYAEAANCYKDGRARDREVSSRCSAAIAFALAGQVREVRSLLDDLTGDAGAAGVDLALARSVALVALASNEGDPGRERGLMELRELGADLEASAQATSAARSRLLSARLAATVEEALGESEAALRLAAVKPDMLIFHSSRHEYGSRIRQMAAETPKRHAARLLRALRDEATSKAAEAVSMYAFWNWHRSRGFQAAAVEIAEELRPRLRDLRQFARLIEIERVLGVDERRRWPLAESESGGEGRETQRAAHPGSRAAQSQQQMPALRNFGYASEQHVIEQQQVGGGPQDL